LQNLFKEHLMLVYLSVFILIDFTFSNDENNELEIY